jgi:protein TonB
MICYNIAKWDVTGRSDPPLSAGEARFPVSSRPAGHTRCGLISLLLHAAAIGALTIVAVRPLQPAPPDAAPVEMVFEEAPPIPEARPQPPRAEAPQPPEPLPPPETPPMETEVEPSPPPVTVQPTPVPDLAPPPPVAVAQPPPKPPPLPKPRIPPPKPVTQTQVERPTTQPPAERPSLQASSAVRIPAPAAPAGPVIDSGWQASVFGWLASRKSYPEEARRRGEEGHVAVRFTVDKSGRVVDAAIVSPSGSTLLDEAALGLLRQAMLPPFPPDMTQARITITTTMRYSLR